MTLKIRPVKLKQSVYVRVPNDIADLIGIDSDTEITLNLEEQVERFLLIYSVTKPEISKTYRQVGRLQGYSEEDAGQLAPIPATRHPSDVKDKR